MIMHHQIYTGTLEDTSLPEEYFRCDFTNLSMIKVELTGVFIKCHFRPADSTVRREGVYYLGEFDGCTGVGA